MTEVALSAPRRRIAAWFLAAGLIVAPACRTRGDGGQAGDSSSPTGTPAGPLFATLVFTKTAGFRHDSIPAGVEAVRGLGSEEGFTVDATEDASVFVPDRLSSYRVVVFLLTTGDVLDDGQQAALQGFVRAGGGFVAVHSAADTEHTWPWFGELIGTRFQSHPEIQRAVLGVADPFHPSTEGLPRRWVRTDEWYNFTSNPRGRVHVLLAVDESSYRGGEHGLDHPISWCREFDGGRSWYTGGGHTPETYAEPNFLGHVLGGIQWAAGRRSASCEPN